MNDKSRSERTSRGKIAGSMLALALGTASVLAPGATPVEAADYTMAIAYLPPETFDNEIHPSLTHFKSIVEAATDGAIEIQLFGGGQLGSEVETAKQAQEGTLLQASIISSGAMSSFYRNYQAVTAPFLFPDYRAAHAFFDGEWFADFMSGTVEEAGLRYFGTFDDQGGFVAVTNGKHLIKTAEDFKGLKIRVEENPAHMAVMKALGASATPLPWGEVVTALSTGLADGQFNAPGISRTYKLWEVNDYTTLSRHIYNSQAWVVSDKWYQTLPEEYQEILIRAARESIGIAHGIAAMQAIRGWQASCEGFKECYVLPVAERENMNAIARPAWRSWIVDDFGLDADLVDGLLGEVDRIVAEQKVEDMDRYGR